jgi:Asp-tRNA(Asn)/Glu-tRNA(Gln) amidotransferase B subunit
LPLIENDVKKILGVIDWMNEDASDLGRLLTFAGKDEASNYEHFRLTQAIGQINAGLTSLRNVVSSFEKRTGKKVEASKPKATYPAVTTTTTVKDKTEKDGLIISIDKLKPIVAEIIEAYPETAKGIKERTPGNLGYLTAKVSIAAGGNGDPKVIQQLITEKVGEKLAAA